MNQLLVSEFAPRKLRAKKRSRQLLGILLILLLLSASLILYKLATNEYQAATDATPQPTISSNNTSARQAKLSASQTPAPVLVPVLPDTTQLATAINKAIASNPDLDIGVSYIDINNNIQLNFGKTTQFVGASTTKLVAAIDFLVQVEKGKYSITQTVNGTTAQSQLQQLVNQSNNDSWYAFINLMGYQQIENYAHSIGLSSYDFTGDNLITPADQAMLLKKLYQGGLLNEAHTKLLLSYMQKTNEEDLIPAALPAGATVYHKYGEIYDNYDEHVGGYLHDTAIIVYNGHTIVLTVYTKNSSGLNDVTQGAAIHDVTKAVMANLN